MGRPLGWIGGFFKVADDSAVERTIFDKDGFLYQLGTKLTVAASTLNAAITASSTDTLTNKTLTTPGMQLKDVSHDYAGAAVDWTLSATEKTASILKVTNANGACAIIGPSETGRLYLVDNQSGQACTVKKAAGTGIAIASTKRAMVWYNGTDYVRITADA